MILLLRQFDSSGARPARLVLRVRAKLRRLGAVPARKLSVLTLLACLEGVNALPAEMRILGHLPAAGGTPMAVSRRRLHTNESRPSGPSDDWVFPNFAQRLSLQIANPGREPIRTLVTLPVIATAGIAPGFPGKLAVVLITNPPGSTYAWTVVPSQSDDLDGDGKADEFEFPAELGAGERRRVYVYYSTTLSGSVTYPQRAHASHAYGYNHETAALESEIIGYRTYGGFLLDVQARAGGHPGLYNDLVGFLSAHEDSELGKDVFHVGDTLGLGGLFLRAGKMIYRPPFNVPDYAHRPSPEQVPCYRVLADGPLRAIVEAHMERWTIGEDEVSLRARYEVDASERSVRCFVRLLPVRLAPSHSYQVGTGVRDLPSERISRAAGLIALEGGQSIMLGRLGLAVYYDSAEAMPSEPVLTPDGTNQVIVFRKPLTAGTALEAQYSVAAAWSGSGGGEPLAQLGFESRQVSAHVVVRDERLERTPLPERVEGEAD